MKLNGKDVVVFLKGNKGEKGDKGDKGERGEKGDSGDIASIDIINEVKKDIDDLYLLSTATVTGTETVNSYGLFNARKTAKGNKGDLSASLIDGALTRVKWVQGHTEVGTDGLLKNAYFKGIKSTGKNLLKGSEFVLPNAAGNIIDYEPFKIAAGTYSYKATVEGYDEPISQCLGFYLYESDKKTLVASAPNAQLNREWTLTLTAEQAKKVAYCSLYFNNATQADPAVGKTVKVMLNFGESVLPYEKYKEDTSFMLDSAQELGVFDGYSPIDKLMRKSTETLTFTGDEDWKLNVVNTEVSNPYAQFYIVLNEVGGDGSERLPVVNMPDIFEPVNAEPLRPNKCFITATGSWFVISTTTDINTIDAWKQYLRNLNTSGIPLQVAYRRATATQTVLDIPTNKYQAWAYGSETAVQGDIDNGAHGATVSTEQTYAVIKGATE